MSPAIVRGEDGTTVSMQPSRLSEPADCQALIELALSTFGRIDVLFNLAAMQYFNWLHDATAGDGGPGARDSRQLDLTRPDRKQRHAGAAQRPGVDIVVDGGMKVW